MTAEERLAEAEERLAELEANHDRLIGVIEGLVGIVARHAGAEVPASQPARPQLRVLPGGAS